MSRPSPGSSYSRAAETVLRVTAFVTAEVLILAFTGCNLQHSAGRADPQLEARLLQALDRGEIDEATWSLVLESDSVEIKRLGATVLASAADPASLPRARRLATSAAPEVWEQLLVAAGRAGAVGTNEEGRREAAELVLEGLDHESPRVRRAAAWAACHLGGEVADQLLRRLSKEQDTAVLVMAAENLWRLEPGSWEADGSALAGHDLPEVREAAASSLARSVSPEREASLVALAGDTKPVVRATALAGMAKGTLSQEAVRAIAAALADPDRRVRTAGLRALAGQGSAEIDDPAVAGAVVGLCASENLQEAAAAINAAAAHPEIPASEVLRQTIEAGSRGPWLASLALEAQVRRGTGGAPGASGGDAVDRAARWLGSDLEWQRRAAARALAAAPAPADVIGTILADPSPGVRLAWLEALPEERIPALAETLAGCLDHDADAAVRAQVLALLGEIEQVPGPERLLELYRSWQDDELGDARTEALLAVIRQTPRELGPGAPLLGKVRDLARTDADDGVAARVMPQLRARSLDVGPPVRHINVGAEWYEALVEWRREPHWIDLVTVRGTVRIQLDPEVAPLTARRIWELAGTGFYDELTLHRVVPNFVIQGGDPRGDGWGGPGFVVPDEPSLEPFDVGAVGIATAGPGTGGCQLFAMLMAAPRLNAHYTRIGRVVRGQDVVERIGVGDRILRAETASGAEPPPPPPVWAGRVEWEDLEQIEGWSEEWAAYHPDPGAIEQLHSASGRYLAISVLGTWCSDSKREVPRLQAVVDATGGVIEHVLIGVDRTKQARDPALPPGALRDDMAELVPTIIFLDEYGQELGRVIETAEMPLEHLIVELIAPWEGW